MGSSRSWASRAGFAPSRFLIPLSYASILGSYQKIIEVLRQYGNVVDTILEVSEGMFATVDSARELVGEVVAWLELPDVLALSAASRWLRSAVLSARFARAALSVDFGVAADDPVRCVEVDRHGVETAAGLEQADRQAERIGASGRGQPERHRGVDRCVGFASVGR